MSKFTIRLTAKADVSGSIDVEAETEHEALEIAKSKAGDIEWKYNGVDDETIEQA